MSLFLAPHLKELGALSIYSTSFSPAKFVFYTFYRTSDFHRITPCPPPQLIEKVIVFTSEQILGTAIIEARIFAQMLIYSSIFYSKNFWQKNIILYRKNVSKILTQNYILRSI